MRYVFQNEQFWNKVVYREPLIVLDVYKWLSRNDVQWSQEVRKGVGNLLIGIL